VVDPYGLVCKAGIWYLVADSGGEPRLFRVSRVAAAEVDEQPVRRRDGVELVALWDSLRREIEDRPGRVAVTARVRRDVLDMLSRMYAANVDGAPADDGPDWVVLPLRFPGVAAVRVLLAFGGDVEVLAPAEVRADLAGTAAATVGRYSSVL